jgi:hypothetical protein
MTVLSTIPPSAPSANLTRQIVLSLFQPIGRCRSLDEKHFDAVTAVCGSGPAFAMLVLEAMADGGVMMGLPRAEALELAAQSGPSARPSARADSQGSHARCSKNGAPDGSPPSRHQGQRHKYALLAHHKLIAHVERSTGRLHHRWPPHARRRPGPQHHRALHPGRHSARGGPRVERGEEVVSLRSAVLAAVCSCGFLEFATEGTKDGLYSEAPRPGSKGTARRSGGGGGASCLGRGRS